MIVNSSLAFVAGLVTILNPCVLPLIPVIITTALGKSRWGPMMLAAGLVFSFSTFGLAVIAFGFSVGVDGEQVRKFAGVLLILAGIVLLVPRLQSALTAAAAPLTAAAHRGLGKLGGGKANGEGGGAGGQFLVGTLLGLIWAPCVGPTLGVAIAAASQGENLFSAFIIFLAFGLGVAASILAFAYGSRKALGTRGKALQKLAKVAKPLFGVSVMLVGFMVLTGLDRALEGFFVELMPQGLIELTTKY